MGANDEKDDPSVTNYSVPFKLARSFASSSTLVLFSSLVGFVALGLSALFALIFHEKLGSSFSQLYLILGQTLTPLSMLLTTFALRGGIREVFYEQLLKHLNNHIEALEKDLISYKETDEEAYNQTLDQLKTLRNRRNELFEKKNKRLAGKN
jgi:hypothetical protein